MSGQLLGRIKLSRNALAEQVHRDLVDQHPISLSAGYRTHQERVDRSTIPETRTAIDWEPLEVSVVSVAAEPLARICQAVDGDDGPLDYEPGSKYARRWRG